MRRGKWNLHIWLGMMIVALLFLMMLISLFYTPHDPNEMNIQERFQSPSSEHWMGTDNFGRDIFSRIMKGAQTSFLVGTISVFTGLVFGTLLGAIAGYFGKWVDEAIMRVMDAMMAFPGLLLALMFIAVLGPGIFNTTIALGIMFIPNFARISRSGFIQYKEFDFVQAARVVGISDIKIIFRHILPNIMSPLIIAASMGFSSAILAEAGLSYLGLGVQPPDPSWGQMLNEAQSHLSKAPWFTLAPGITIIVTVVGFNLLGDGIRDLGDRRS